jgi:uncharacterized protein (TIGR00369 family)
MLELKTPADIDPDANRQTGLDILRAASAGELEAPPAAKLLGWHALHLEPGLVRMRFEAREEFYNPHGAVQGGILAAMLDDTLGPAGFTLLDEGAFAPTIGLNVTFIRPARAGYLIGEGRVVHRSRGYLHLEGKLTTEDGELIATATATAAIKGGIA